jgi:hypothetical protein
MHLRLHYTNGELYTDTGIPLTQVAVATGLEDPSEATLPELLDGLVELGYTSVHITLAKQPSHRKHTRHIKHAKRARRTVARPVV